MKVLRVLLPLLFLAPLANAQRLDESCTVNILNRTAQVDEHGGYVLPNIPVDRGLYRLRAVCERDGRLLRGQTKLLDLVPNGTTEVGEVEFTRQIPIPQSLTLYAVDDRVVLTEEDETVELATVAQIADGRISILDGRVKGTIYVSSDPSIASVNEDGIVTAHRRGRVNIVVVNEGRVAGLDMEVDLPNDRDGDGLEDEYEIANGLNPDDPTDAALDPDNDGLTNLEEQQLGTSIRVGDTDGDGILDGAEAGFGTDPTRADTDRDGLSDGEERERRTHPTLADTDGDGIDDGTEVEYDLDPLQPNATTTITGRVIDPDGIAVVGAVVVIAQNYVVNTDDRGGFAIEGVIADNPLQARVRFVDDGVVMDARTALIDPVIDGTTDLGEIQLRRILNAVGGTIYGPRGEPVPDARVRVIVGEEERTTNADRGGIYLIRHVEEGDVMVIATDSDTGLRGRSFGTLAPDEAVTIDVRLSASGTIEGRVYGRDNTPLGEGITVSLRGPRYDEVQTDELGRYRFDFIPLGRYTLEAFDLAGNRGRTNAAITGTNQVVIADISFLGVGQVNGRVETGGGAPVAGANILIVGRGPFGGRINVASQADGTFTADNVFIGRFDVSATDPASGLAGVASGLIDFEGDVAEVTVTLRGAASLTGQLLTSDGATVEGGSVTLDPSGRTVVTGADGSYRFDAVPLGVYSVVGAAPMGPDRGRAQVNLVDADAEVVTDVNLLGLGEVNVTVRDADGETVNGAQVIISSNTGFDYELASITDNDGRTRLTDVLAGPFTVDAVDPLSGLVGRLESTVLPGESVSLVVELEGAGSITGQTLAPDGQTPIANVRVHLEPGDRDVSSDALGQFRFDLLSVAGGPYTLRAFDANGTLRATVGNLALMNHGDEIAQNLVLSGTGTVSGLITNPDGSNASAVAVTIESDVEGAPPRYATTAADGTYRIEGIPEGLFTVTASNRPLRRAGSERGNIDFDGEMVTVDVAMDENIIPPSAGDNPVLARLFDANNLQWSVLQDGRSQDGTQSIFRGDAQFHRGAMALVIRVEGGVEAIPFEARGGRFELDGQQVVIPGVALGDVQVTRKIYAPNTGYFVRYVEIIENTGAAATTVDVQIASYFRFIGRVRQGLSFSEAPRVILTSNGDNSVNFGAEADRWAIIDDDQDVDPFLAPSWPAFAHVFDGEGDDGADVGAFSISANATYGTLRAGWTAVQIPAGSSVAIMHFGVQQINQAGARAAAERLTNAPIEALAGLTDDERAAIINFDVNAGAGLEPLPAIDGTVGGTVYEGDGETTVRQAQVYFRSQHPLFGRTWNTRADVEGIYALSSQFRTGARNLAVPHFAFDVFANHPTTGLTSNISAGDFDGAEIPTEDIVFGNAGGIIGQVRRTDGNVVSTGTVSLMMGNRQVRVPIAEDGRYQIGGLDPGNYTLTAAVPIPGGTPLGGSAQTAVIAGETEIVDITIVPTGGVEGIVRDGGGNIAIEVTVALRGDDFARGERTDTGGRYAFLDVPVGDFSVEATEPRSGLITIDPISVEAFEMTTHDLVLASIGRVRVTVTLSSGRPAVNAPIQILRERLGNFYRSAGRTNAQGILVIEGVPEGNFSVRALNPDNSALVTLANGMIVDHDETVELAIEIPVDDPPEVELTSPVAGEYIEGSRISLRANAFDDLGIRRVEFLVDGEVVATDHTRPFIQSWTLPQGNPAMLTVMARAFDTGPNQTDSAPVIIQRIEDQNDPTVAFASPFDGASFIEGTQVTIVAQANDDIGVSRVEFFVDGLMVEVDDTPPYRVTAPLPQNAADNGERNLPLRLVAYDRAGNSAQAMRSIQVIPDQPPSVEILSAPAEGTRIVEGTPIEITAAANDDVGVAVDLIVGGQVVATRNQRPFVFSYIAPAADAVNNPFEITVQARDTQGQTASEIVSVEVTTDQPPTVDITSPEAGTDVVEGSTVRVSADVDDELGVIQVQFMMAGIVVATRVLPPYEADVRIQAGDAGLAEVTVRATDTAGQTGEDTVMINRIDDEVAPTGQITSPVDGANIVVGSTDVVFVLSPTVQNDVDSLADYDGDGENETLLEAQIFTAKAMFDQLDPDSARVAIIRYGRRAQVLQSLTPFYADVDMAFDALLNAPRENNERTGVAFDAGYQHAIGPDAARTAAPIVYVFAGNDDWGINPATAVETGVTVNGILLGPGVDQGQLRSAVQATGGTFTIVRGPGDVPALVNSVLTGTDALIVDVDADDDVAVRQVIGRVNSDDDTVNDQASDASAPYSLAFGLPPLEVATEVSISATISDYGDNTFETDPVTVTLLSASAAPSILELSSAIGAPDEVILIRGRFFDPIFAQNMVTFGGVEGRVINGTKSHLTVGIPVGARSGDLIVTADGEASEPVYFGFDVDSDGLDELEEADLGTDPENPDTDDDGLIDGQEIEYGADPLNPDTDGDGLPDGFEVDNGFDPTQPGEEGVDDDNDGLSNAGEILAGTDPLDPDSDDDFLLDGAEVMLGTDPLLADTDGGGTFDGYEVNEDGTDPLDPEDDVPHIGLGVRLRDVANFLWDIQQDGNISNGTSDAYDGGLQLSIDGSNFPGFATAVAEDEGRELRIGSWSHAELRIRRKIYVPDDDRFARFLEIFENPTENPIQISVNIRSNLGSDGGTVLVDESSGDDVFDLTDDWLITDDQDAGRDPSMAHLFSGLSAALEPMAVGRNGDNFNYAFTVSVPANSTAILMHFAIQNANRADALAQVTQLHALQGSALAGLSAEEQAQIVNFVAYADTDQDGIPDSLEVELGTDPENPDTDGDGMTDGFEVRYGLNPLQGDELADADNDGLTNGQEHDFGTDPTVEDSDGDTLSDGFEVATSNTNPTNPDSDGDGLNDAVEWNGPSDPNNPDTDEDGLTDGDEANRGTDPVNPDSDGDGANDGWEVQYGFNPNFADADQDPDNDGLDNAAESAANTNPYDNDSDDDLLMDGPELNEYGTDPMLADTDEGGRPDGAEILIDGTDATNAEDDLPVVELTTVLTDGGGFNWDINTQGSINDGSQDAFDGGYFLDVSNSRFNGPFDAGLRLGEREVVLGPWQRSNLIIARQIYVPDDDAFTRFREILINPTDAEIQVEVAINGRVGSGNDTQLIGTSTNQDSVSLDDNWVVTDDSNPNAGDPVVFHLFSDDRVDLQPNVVIAGVGNQFSYAWTVVVPAHDRVALMHFSAQHANRPDALANVVRISRMQGRALEGMTPEEQAEVLNIEAYLDSDGDGLSDDAEDIEGTDPNDPDTDGDGINDGWEVEHGFDPLVDDSALDPDMDGLSNLGEYQNGTDPAIGDVDMDGLGDGGEILAGSDPFEADTDRDSLNDGDEVNVYGTDPTLEDTDGGGTNDNREVLVDMTDPNNPLDDIVSPYPLECDVENYEDLDSVGRGVNIPNGNVSCDGDLFPDGTWFRLSGADGDRMPDQNEIPEVRRCGTHATGWLEADHPEDAEHLQNVRICYNWSGNICNWSAPTEVINCGNFFIYQYNNPNTCSLRVCATDAPIAR